MKVTIFAVIGATTVMSVTPVVSFAQSINRQNLLPVNSTTSSNALFDGINSRTAEDDFSQFFGVTTDSDSAGENTNSTTSKVITITDSDSLSSPDTPFMLQPAQSNSDWNEGMQLQLNLQDLERSNQR